MISLKIEGVYGINEVAIRCIHPVVKNSNAIQVIVSDEYYMVQLPDDLKFKIKKCQHWDNGTFLISLDIDKSESVTFLIKEHISKYIEHHIKILSKSDLRNDLLDELIS